MNRISNLKGAIFAVLLLSLCAPSAQAGDGLFGRLRNKTCRTKCVPVPTCEQLCIQKCYENYCNRVKFLEPFRCTDPAVYELGMYLAKAGYCLGVKECRNPCLGQPVATAPVGGVTDPETCRLNYENCIATFAAWQNGLAGKPQPTTPCIDMYFVCMGIKQPESN